MNKLSHRKSTATVRVLRPDGSPVANERVRVRQTSHEFLFGCGGFEAVEYAGGNRDGTPLDAARSALRKDRLDKTFALCNYATLPFYLGYFEPVEGDPDTRRLLAAARYFMERGVKTKGHPLCWHEACADWLLACETPTILAKQLARIRREISGFKGLTDSWDVINEPVVMPVFEKCDSGPARVCREIGRVGIVRETFAAARETHPGAFLLINDYDHSAQYENLIEECLAAGVSIDAIGIQSHQHWHYVEPEKLDEILARFGRFGLPLHFTENTVLSAEQMTDCNFHKVREHWPTTPEGEENQRTRLVKMYTTLFEHPRVEAVTNWESTDGGWLGAPAGFLRADNSEKPSYHALMKLIHGDWKTELTLLTGPDGRVEFTGFRGGYEAEAGGGITPFTLGKATSEIIAILPG